MEKNKSSSSSALSTRCRCRCLDRRTKEEWKGERAPTEGEQHSLNKILSKIELKKQYSLTYRQYIQKAASEDKSMRRLLFSNCCKSEGTWSRSKDGLCLNVNCLTHFGLESAQVNDCSLNKFLLLS